MYKITLYDANNSLISDNVACFFTEDIDSLKAHLAASSPDAGLFSQDDLPAGSSIQEEETKIICQKSFDLRDTSFKATNSYGLSQTYHIDHWHCRFVWIDFGGTGYRIAEYAAQGVCMIDHFFDRLKSVTCYGNPVLENEVVFNPIYSYRVPKKDWLTPTYEDFAQNSIRTICFLTSKTFAPTVNHAGKPESSGPDAASITAPNSSTNNLQEIMAKDCREFTVTEEIMDALFADVIGEAG